MNKPRLAVTAHPSRLLLAFSFLALLGACSSSSTPKPDLTACDGNTMVTLNAVPVPGGGGGGGGMPTLKIHYHRADGVYTGWVLHAWGAAQDPGWSVGYPQAGTESFGVFFPPTILPSSTAATPRISRPTRPTR
jgi:pullulanase